MVRPRISERTVKELALAVNLKLRKNTIAETTASLERILGRIEKTIEQDLEQTMPEAVFQAHRDRE